MVITSQTTPASTGRPQLMVRAIATLAVAATLMFAGTGTASASTTAGVDTLTSDQQQEFAEAEIALDHLDRASNNFNFQDAVDAGASDDTAQRFAYGVLLSGGTIENSATPVTLPAELAKLAPSLTACKGGNAVSTEWYGHRVQMDSCITTRMITILGGSGGIAAGVAYISTAFPPVAPIAGVLVAAMAIAGGGLAICGSNGYGLVMYQVWTGQPWCTGP